MLHYYANLNQLLPHLGICPHCCTEGVLRCPVCHGCHSCCRCPALEEDRERLQQMSKHR